MTNKTIVAVRHKDGTKEIGTIAIDTLDNMRKAIVDYILFATGRTPQTVLILVPRA